MIWQFASSGNGIVANLQERSDNSLVWGAIEFGGHTYPVHGAWQEPLMPPRVNNNICLRGAAEIAPNVWSYVALSGTMVGSGQSMSIITVGLSEISNNEGAVNFMYETLTPVTLNTPVPPDPGGAVPPTDVPWNLKSADGAVEFNGNVSAGGGVAGAMTVNGTQYQMGGAWSASTPNGGPFSCFAATGTFRPQPSSPSNDYLSVCGSLKNVGLSPQELQIAGNIAPTTAGQNTPVSATLLPAMNMDQLALDAAYAESYMVIQIGGPGGDSQALAGWTGPGGNVVAPFGANGNYKGAGVAMSPAVLAGIVKPDNTPRDATYDIDIPTFASTVKTNRPVMLQFVGSYDHFMDPPLMAYHEQISKIFYDENVGALVLQFLDNSGEEQETTPLNFNHKGHIHPRSHESVIIQSFA